MGTATSSGAGPALAALALALIASGCGGGSPTSSTALRPTAAPVSAQPSQGASAGTFEWLRPGPVPAGWNIAKVPSGATLPYPPGWKPVAGDRGTATAVLRGPRSAFLGYLNLTPRQGRETLSNWGRFRVRHNGDEGDRSVATLASDARLTFRTGHGSCVRDAYTTATGVRYIELACLVAGTRTSSVIVGASPPEAWPQVSPLIERAISSMTT